MNIAFDGTCLDDGPVTGVGRAFLNGLAAYAAAFPNEAILLLPAHAPRPQIAGLTIVDAPRGALRRQLEMPRILQQLAADVLHSPVVAVPLLARCPTIATVHDLPWLHSEARERTSWWRKFATRRSLLAAAAVLAPSTFTLRDAQTIAGDQARVHLVPHGCDRRSDEPTAEDTAERAGPFIVLGDDRPRKNLAAIAAAHELATERSPLVPPLRFVGPPAAWVGEDEKLRLLHTCSAVVHCARFEGFGMPVLEAMAHGAPVVCSDIPPLREIAGDDAVYVDPDDIESIAAGLSRVLEPTLRTSLTRNGWRRAAEFSTAATAKRWRALHEELAR